MLETGYKISDLNNIPVTGAECIQKNKIALDETYMLGYAHSIYGIKYNRNNYKIPLKSIRDDLKGYIGIESLVAPWSEQLKLWHGLWRDAASKNRSYVYEWQESEANHSHYMPEKFADLENSYYIIRNAPFPYETEDCNNRGERGEIIPELNIEGENIISTNKKLEASDPHPSSNKLVLKDYVDERLASKRLIDVKTEFWVRDYDCNYVIRSKELIDAAKMAKTDDPITIKIHYPDKFEERVKNNNLEFTLMVEGIETEEGSGIYKPAISNLVKWELYDSQSKQLNICWLNKTDKDEIIIPNIHEERLYDNARYILFTFRTITDKVENFDKIEIIDGKEEKTGEYTKAFYAVYAACENMLYRNRALTTINNEIVEHLHFVSTDNSVIINKEFESGTLILDTVVNQDTYDVVSPDNSVIIDTVKNGKHTSFEISVPKQEKPKEIEIVSSPSVEVKEIHTKDTKYYQFEVQHPELVRGDSGITIKDQDGSWLIGTNISLESSNNNINIEEIENNDNKGWKISAKNVQLVELPEIIDFSIARHEVYKVSNTAEINSLTDNLEENETVTTKIYFNTSGNINDVYITGEVEWVMTKDNFSPAFKPNKLYCISITALPNFIAGSGYKVLGRIEWFQNL